MPCHIPPANQITDTTNALWSGSGKQIQGSYRHLGMLYSYWLWPTNTIAMSQWRDSHHTWSSSAFRLFSFPMRAVKKENLYKCTIQKTAVLDKHDRNSPVFEFGLIMNKAHKFIWLFITRIQNTGAKQTRNKTQSQPDKISTFLSPIDK